VSLKEMFCVSPGIWDSLQTSLQGTCRVKTGQRMIEAHIEAPHFMAFRTTLFSTLLQHSFVSQPPCPESRRCQDTKVGEATRRSPLPIEDSIERIGEKIRFILIPPQNSAKPKKGHTISILGKKLKHS